MGIIYHQVKHIQIILYRKIMLSLHSANRTYLIHVFIHAFFRLLLMVQGYWTVACWMRSPHVGYQVFQLEIGVKLIVNQNKYNWPYAVCLPVRLVFLWSFTLAPGRCVVTQVNRPIDLLSWDTLLSICYLPNGTMWRGKQTELSCTNSVCFPRHIVFRFMNVK